MRTPKGNGEQQAKPSLRSNGASPRPYQFDIRKESQETLDLYGRGDVARGALMAVRLVEKGVRMVQLYYSKGDPWDAYADIFAHKVNARNSDQTFAAVIKDLKARGLWNDTLVVCGSEFGRTPVRDVGGMANQAKRGRITIPSALRCGSPVVL